MREDAILELVSQCGVIPGKKVFQKLCYFLQEAESVRLGVRFRMKHYGPYSEELDDGVEELGERHLVEIAGSSEEGYRISPGRMLEVHDLLHEASEEVGGLLSKLQGELMQGLTIELLATAHFLAQRQSYKGTDEDKEALTLRVRAWKGSKFDANFIRQNIEKLEELGYLPAAAA